MYMREYNEQGAGILIPESYSGTALRDNDTNEPQVNISEPIQTKNPWESEEKTAEVSANEAPTERNGILGSLASGISSVFGIKPSLSISRIGTEEILILGVIAFLIFSKQRDMECALILIALLFIH